MLLNTGSELALLNKLPLVYFESLNHIIIVFFILDVSISIFWYSSVCEHISEYGSLSPKVRNEMQKSDLLHPFPSPPQVFLDMVENYPTCLRVLVLAENAISPELQQQICDLLSEGEEDEEKEAGPATSSNLLPTRDKHQPPTWLPHSSKG